MTSGGVAAADPAAGAGTKRVNFAEAPPVAAPLLKTGQRVVIKGLEKARDLNGHRGVVVRYKDDVGRYAVRVAGKEIAIRRENLDPEGGAAAAKAWVEKKQQSKRTIEGTAYPPQIHERTPGFGPKQMQGSFQVRAGQRRMVKANKGSGCEDEPVPLWFGDQGFVGTAPVDVAILIADIGADHEEWPKALARTLDHIPVAAGRLRQMKGVGGAKVWKIALNNAGVPFTIAEVPPCSLPDAESLQAWCFDDHAGVFDMSRAEEVQEEPLLRMKLTYEQGTARGVLGITFSHALCDITGVAALLRRLHSEVDRTVPAPVEVLCHDRAAADQTLEAVPECSPEDEARHAPHWPLWPRALERWCFAARRLRSGMRGRPDAPCTVALTLHAEAIAVLKREAEEKGITGVSSFELLVSLIGLILRRSGRSGRHVLLTKDYRAALGAAAPGTNLEQLFGNVVTHGLAFELPEEDADDPLLAAMEAVRVAIDAVSLEFVRWQSRTNHYRGLPNFFGGLCCNSWGRALSSLELVEAYAIGPRACDERAGNMVFPLDCAYMQMLPQPSGAYGILLSLSMQDAKMVSEALCELGLCDASAQEVRRHSIQAPLSPTLAREMDALSGENERRFVRIACIGDSLTACGYPQRLQQLFERAGVGATVRNFGVVGATAIRFSDKPYWDEPKLQIALDWRPHIVVSTFGTNDSKVDNWDEESFEREYAELLDRFLKREVPRPSLFLVMPPPVYIQGEDGWPQQSIVNGELASMIPRITEAVAEAVNEPLRKASEEWKQAVPSNLFARSEAVDAFELLGGSSLKRPSFFADDGVHPNERGTHLLALVILASVRREVERRLARWADVKTVVSNDPGF